VYATDVSANGTYLKKKNNVDCVSSQGRGILMGHSSTFLLDDGDELQISEMVRLIFYSMKPIQQAEFSPIQEREKAIFAHNYLITGRLLGEGGYGKVVIGIDRTTQRQLACKIIKLDHLYDRPPAPNLRLPTGPRDQNAGAGRKRWPTRVAACFREFDILKDLKHPNIINIEKVFWSNNTIYIFQELVTGGDLFSFLEYKGGRLDDTQAVVIIRQILIGVEYLHSQDIVHRDLKPDNILMTSLEDGARVVITDFGNARFLPDATCTSNRHTKGYQRMFSYVGTLEYAAPEIHKANPTIPIEEGYTKSVDMWSIGSITATILSGDVIFTDRTHPQYHDNARVVIIGLAAQCDLSVLDDDHHPTWSGVDSLSKDFIKHLLVLDEHDRMTATEALAHVWLANNCYAEDLCDLYARSVQGWLPRPANSQLVERISKPLPDLNVIRLPGQTDKQNTISSFSHAAGQYVAQDIMQTLSASQYWSTSTPLPSITDEHTNKQYQCASPIAPVSHDTDIADCAFEHYGDTESSNQQQKQSCNICYKVQRGQKCYNICFCADQDDSNPMTQQEQITYHIIAPDKRTADNVAEQEGSSESTGSLNNVKHVAYSQHPYSSTTWQQTTSASQEVILVHETPIHEDDADAKATNPEGSYQPTLFPEEDQASVLVYETPPESNIDHDRSTAEDLPY
jgi:serine/threonine protein kinase